ncbi:MAG: HAMP domain-containing sensor histidine kinase [Bacillota bacterium]
MKTIFSKLLISFIFTIVVCLLVAGISISLIVRDYITDQKEKELVVKAQDIAQSTKHFFINGENPHEYINMINRLDSNLGTEVWAIDENGVIIAAASSHTYCEGSYLNDTQLSEMKSGKLNIYKGYSDCFDDPVIRVTSPIKENDKVLGAIIVYSPIKGIDQATSRLILMIIISVVFALAISLAICYFITKRIAKPIQDLTEASIAVVGGNRKVKVYTNTDFKEFNQLAGTFNYMLKKLDENEKRMKDFVANVSHELKSPITSLKGFTEALIDGKGKTEERTQRFLNIMNKEADRLSKLVDNLLILCKSDSKISIEPQRINIKDVIDEVLLSFETKVLEKSISINIVDNAKKPYVIADSSSLKQILINLLDNTIKYSPQNSMASILISESADKIKISITDNGPGIPKEDIPYIWDRFYRVDKARSRETGGTGLGLAIVKELVEKNGGIVDVTSHIDKGTTFSFELPRST